MDEMNEPTPSAELPHPACWAWPVTAADLDAAAAVGGHTDEVAAHLAGLAAIQAWQRGRCAACDDEMGAALLVVDHDHATALVRGLLCASCNTLEGVNRPNTHAYWDRYRDRHPASILGVRVRYRHAAGTFAEPRPPMTEEELWRNNPVRSLGL